MEKNETSDMRRAMESAEVAQDAYERLLAAASRVWTEARPDPDDPNRVIVSAETMAYLGGVLTDLL